MKTARKVVGGCCSAAWCLYVNQPHELHYNEASFSYKVCNCSADIHPSLFYRWDKGAPRQLPPPTIFHRLWLIPIHMHPWYNTKEDHGNSIECRPYIPLIDALLLCLTPSKGEPVDMTLVLFRYQKAGCSQSFEWHTKTSAIMVASRICDGSKMIVARLNISVMANSEAMFMTWNAMVDARRAYPQSQLQVSHDTPCIHSQRSYTSCSGSTPMYPVHIYHSVRSRYVILCLPKYWWYPTTG